MGASRKVTIVIAWLTSETEFVRARRTDLGELPITKQTPVPHAATWVLKGDLDTDLPKAESYAAQLRADPDNKCVKVCVYDTSESDPLGRAKAAVLTGVKV